MVFFRCLMVLATVQVATASPIDGVNFPLRTLSVSTSPFQKPKRGANITSSVFLSPITTAYLQNILNPMPNQNFIEDPPKNNIEMVSFHPQNGVNIGPVLIPHKPIHCDIDGSIKLPNQVCETDFYQKPELISLNAVCPIYQVTNLPEVIFSHPSLSLFSHNRFLQDPSYANPVQLKTCEVADNFKPIPCYENVLQNVPPQEILLEPIKTSNSNTVFNLNSNSFEPYDRNMLPQIQKCICECIVENQPIPIHSESCQNLPLQSCQSLPCQSCDENNFNPKLPLSSCTSCVNSQVLSNIETANPSRPLPTCDASKQPISCLDASNQIQCTDIPNFLNFLNMIGYKPNTDCSCNNDFRACPLSKCKISQPSLAEVPKSCCIEDVPQSCSCINKPSLCQEVSDVPCTANLFCVTGACNNPESTCDFSCNSYHIPSTMPTTQCIQETHVSRPFSLAKSCSDISCLPISLSPSNIACDCSKTNSQCLPISSCITNSCDYCHTGSETNAEVSFPVAKCSTSVLEADLPYDCFKTIPCGCTNMVSENYKDVRFPVTKYSSSCDCSKTITCSPISLSPACECSNSNFPCSPIPSSVTSSCDCFNSASESCIDVPLTVTKSVSSPECASSLSPFGSSFTNVSPIPDTLSQTNDLSNNPPYVNVPFPVRGSIHLPEVTKQPELEEIILVTNQDSALNSLTNSITKGLISYLTEKNPAVSSLSTGITVEVPALNKLSCISKVDSTPVVACEKPSYKLVLNKSETSCDCDSSAICKQGSLSCEKSKELKNLLSLMLLSELVKTDESDLGGIDLDSFISVLS